MNNQASNTQEKIAIKGNNLVQYSCAFVGILALLVGGSFWWAGYMFNIGFLYFFSIIFCTLAVWLLVTFFKTKNQFVILSDEQVLHLLAWGKSISVPYKFLKNG